MTTTALVVVTDGRNYLLQHALRSAVDNLPPFSPWILVDDSGAQAAGLFYDRFAEVISHEPRQGLAAAVNAGWQRAAELGCDYVFHLEDDFTFEVPPDLRGMAALLVANPYLAQVSLKRQPVNGEEHSAGGFVEANPDAYLEREAKGRTWIEHRECYTLNPHLVPRRVFARGWPVDNEAGQTARLNEDPRNRFAIWGAKHAPPRVMHHGNARTAEWRP